MMTVSVNSDLDNVIDYPDDFFVSQMRSEWFDDPLVEDIVRYVDKTEHLKGVVFESPVLGAIGPKDLSSGAKALILIAKSEWFREFKLSSTMFGCNCLPYLVKLSYLVDFKLDMRHALEWGTGDNPNWMDSTIEDADISFSQKNVCAQTAEFPSRKLSKCIDIWRYYVECL